MHSDHYRGMVTNWDNGIIYCTNISKLLMLNLFPGAKNVITIELDTPTLINID